MREIADGTFDCAACLQGVPHTDDWRETGAVQRGRNPMNASNDPKAELGKEPAVAVRQSDRALHFTPQNDQLMSERRILCLKPALRL